jgi:hypothetical protein
VNLSELLIIYLACGSPFGVYQFTRSQLPLSLAGWARIISSFLFWPGFAIMWLAARLTSRHSKEGDAGSPVEQIRSKIEDIAFSEGTTSSLFEFREVFYRFTGLFEAAYAAMPKRSSSEIFEISGHPDNQLASRCIVRRNRERLLFHQVCARNEFVDVLAGAAAFGQSDDAIIRLGIELAEHLGDGDAVADLAALARKGARPKPDDTDALGQTSPAPITRSASSVN